jgi:hypothetical protein
MATSNNGESPWRRHAGEEDQGKREHEREHVDEQQDKQQSESERQREKSRSKMPLMLLPFGLLLRTLLDIVFVFPRPWYENSCRLKVSTNLRGSSGAKVKHHERQGCRVWCHSRSMMCADSD